MRIRFTRAGYAMAAGVAVIATLGLSVAAASAGAKPDATSACGKSCVDVSFVVPGRQAILAVHSGYPAYNNLVRLLQGSNGAYKEDFSQMHVGKVDTLYCHGATPFPGSVFTFRQCQLLKIAGLDKATTFELAFNPNNGGTKQLCIGAWNNTAPVVDGKFRLVTCGVSADTVLIESSKLPGGHTSKFRHWLINGGSDNFSNPVVATSDGRFPSDPRWETVDINGGHGIDTQEVRISKGPF